MTNNRRFIVCLLSLLVSFAALAQDVADSPVIRKGNKYVYGEKVMKKREMQLWLEQQNCPDASVQFNTGFRQAKAGWALFLSGLCLDGVGMTMCILNRNADNVMPTVGWSLIGVGSAMEVACIPLLCVGYSKMHSAVDTYNVSCRKNDVPQAYFSLQAGSQGLGIACHF